MKRYFSTHGFQIDFSTGTDVFSTTHSVVIYKGKMFYACSFAKSRFAALLQACRMFKKDFPNTQL